MNMHELVAILALSLSRIVEGEEKYSQYGYRHSARGK